MTKPKIRIKGQQEHEEMLIEANIYFSSPKDNLQLISSGCEILNCVIGGGWPLGRIANIVGDRSTGKTLLAIEAMANFCAQFPDGQAVYCETEAAFDDDYAEALGLNMKRIQRDECTTVEELFDNLVAFIAKVGAEGQGLYIVDSLDALSDKAEQERGIADSTYGASKPKQLGQLFRRLAKPLEQSGVCVMIISQVRDAIGVAFGEKHTRSGGKALDFYASQIVWLANMGQIKKTINKTQRTIGVTIKARCKKCKIGMPFREATFDIIFGYGVDDIGSNLEFLKDAGELPRFKLGSTDQAIAQYKKSFAAEGTEEQAVERLRLAEIVRKVWFGIEKSFLPPKGKYAH
jgi:recombination protein RecA